MSPSLVRPRGRWMKLQDRTASLRSMRVGYSVLIVGSRLSNHAWTPDHAYVSSHDFNPDDHKFRGCGDC